MHTKVKKKKKDNKKRIQNIALNFMEIHYSVNAFERILKGVNRILSIFEIAFGV